MKRLINYLNGGWASRNMERLKQIFKEPANMHGTLHVISQSFSSTSQNPVPGTEEVQYPVAVTWPFLLGNGREMARYWRQCS